MHLARAGTVVSCIAGGFTIDKGLDALHKARVASGEAWVNHGHAAGMVLTVAGTVLMVLVVMILEKAYIVLKKLSEPLVRMLPYRIMGHKNCTG